MDNHRWIYFLVYLRVTRQRHRDCLWGTWSSLLNGSWTCDPICKNLSPSPDRGIWVTASTDSGLLFKSPLISKKWIGKLSSTLFVFQRHEVAVSWAELVTTNFSDSCLGRELHYLMLIRGMPPKVDWDVLLRAPLYANDMSMMRNSTFSVDDLGQVPRVKGRDIMPTIGVSCPVKLTRPLTWGFRIFVIDPHISKGIHRQDIAETSVSHQEPPYFNASNVNSDDNCVLIRISDASHIFVVEAYGVSTSRFLPRHFSDVDGASIPLSPWMWGSSYRRSALDHIDHAHGCAGCCRWWFSSRGKAGRGRL